VIDLRLGRWQDVLADVECDALIVDAPYSERTHSGQPTAIPYPRWTPADVEAFVGHWEPRTRGWFVTLTDHVLAPVWAAALASMGRYVFSPIACVEPGSRVRQAGDGPAQWSVWAIVGRTERMSKWGSLRGAYVVPGGLSTSEKSKPVFGGKPMWLMREIVRDYSRGDDLVCDPCAGGGTTLLAAAIEGRRAVGAECMPEHAEIARARIARGFTPSLFAE
jgi:hypothetical protein